MTSPSFPSGRRSPGRRIDVAWLAAAMAAVLWVASGAINGALVWNGFLGGSIGAVLPDTIPLFVWARTPLWAALAALIGACAIVVAHRLVVGVVGETSSSRTRFVIVWFATIAAGALVGFAADATTIIDAFPPGRLQMLLNGLGTQAAIGAYWGLVQGWVPALMLAVLARRRARVPRTSTDGREPSRRGLAILSAVVVVALATVVGIGVAGVRDANRAAVQQDAVANGFDESSGALPDPYAEGVPVPTVAPDAASPAADWCTPDQAAMLIGEPDAATGHRVLSVKLMNFSDAPCVVDGYPDFAFADQNDHLLDVTIEHGSSFVATDPGPQRVEIPAGGSAITYLGWDAAATGGQLVATKMFGAQYAGAVRGSWPVDLDVVAGSTVAVTAWALQAAVG
ncbi:hypothetical protein ASF06_09230 [Agreia sp. Leaf244]|uniref:DUF4232 domain-containing protein n=1 Tax=Agreia sp. Leaf244 TaxID=1736305 RepID=UPI0006F2B866|nr:DUF4232 domain-containing protein [Agreia sp. Leaf244]KQO10340.1 hypothetical protein ASF06_09230 [Agreia sp. Leaf244]